MTSKRPGKTAIRQRREKALTRLLKMIQFPVWANDKKTFEEIQNLRRKLAR